MSKTVPSSKRNTLPHPEQERSIPSTPEKSKINLAFVKRTLSVSGQFSPRARMSSRSLRDNPYPPSSIPEGQDIEEHNPLKLSNRPRKREHEHEHASEEKDAAAPQWWEQHFDEDVRRYEGLAAKERKRIKPLRTPESGIEIPDGATTMVAGQPVMPVPARQAKSSSAGKAELGARKLLQDSVPSLVAKRWWPVGHQTAEGLLGQLPASAVKTLTRTLILLEQEPSTHSMNESQREHRIRQRIGLHLLTLLASELPLHRSFGSIGALESALGSRLSLRFDSGSDDEKRSSASDGDLLDGIIDMLYEGKVSYAVSKEVDLAPENFHPAFWRQLQNACFMMPKFKESIEIIHQRDDVSGTFLRDFDASVYRYRSADGNTQTIASIDDFVKHTGALSRQVSYVACQNLSIFLSRALFNRIKADGTSDSVLHLADGTPVAPTDRMVACHELSHTADGRVQLTFTGTIDTAETERQAKLTGSEMKYTARLHLPASQQTRGDDDDDLSKLMNNVGGPSVVIRQARAQVTVTLTFDQAGQVDIGPVGVEAEGWNQAE